MQFCSYAVMRFCFSFTLHALAFRLYAFTPLRLSAKIIINYCLIIKQPLNKFVYLLSGKNNPFPSLPPVGGPSVKNCPVGNFSEGACLQGRAFYPLGEYKKG